MYRCASCQSSSDGRSQLSLQDNDINKVMIKSSRSSTSSNHFVQQQQQHDHHIKMQQQHHRMSKLLSSLAIVILTTTTLLLLLLTQQIESSSSFIVNPPQSNNDIDIVISSNSKPTAEEYEYYVLPGTSFKLECKVPSEGKNSYVWLRTPPSHGSPGGHKSQIISIKSEFRQGFPGIQSDFDERTGQYNLIVHNATYDLHEGHYTCDYSPHFTKTIQVIIVSAPTPPIITDAAIPAREGVEYQLNCSSTHGNPDPQLIWYRNGQPLEGAQAGKLIPSGNRLVNPTVNVLTIIPHMEDHTSVYTCKVSGKALEMYAKKDQRNYQEGYQMEHRLLVEYAPRITVGPANPLRVNKGHDVQMTCQVLANPPVRGVKWFKDKKLLSNSYNYTIKNVNKNDTNLYYCEADNGVPKPGMLQQQQSNDLNSSPARQNIGFFQSIFGQQQQDNEADSSPPTAVRVPLKLDVLYPPSVVVNTDMMDYNEGDTATLSCQVDSSPAPYRIIWTNLDRGIIYKDAENHMELKLFPVTADTAGQYECQVFVRMEPTQLSLPLDNQQQQQQLQLQMEHKASGKVQVRVNHKPGKAELLIGISSSSSSLNSTTNGVSELGRQTTLSCRAKPPGWPLPSYVISKKSPFNGIKKLIASSQNHSIVSTTQADEGFYTCQATNALGQSSEAEAELIVNEQPSLVIPPSSEDRRIVGDRYSITVRAKGKPKPRVIWLHRDIDTGKFVEIYSSPQAPNSGEQQFSSDLTTLTSTSNSQGQQAQFLEREQVSMTSMFVSELGRFKIENKYNTVDNPKNRDLLRQQYEVQTTLYFDKLALENRGHYEIRFENGLSKGAVASQDLHIEHGPMFKHAHDRQAYDINETAQLKCIVSAYPMPSIDWSDKDGRSLSVTPRYKIQSIHLQDDLWESTLTFAQVQEEDYANFTCEAQNQLSAAQQQNTGDNNGGGVVKTVVRLVKKSVPDMPTQVRAIEVSHDSITLQWTPGFDGGYSNETTFNLLRGLAITTNNNNNNGPTPAAADPSKQYNFNGLLEPVNSQQQQQQYNSNNNNVDGLRTEYDCGNSTTCIVNNLKSRETYFIRVSARNPLGTSGYSDEIYVTTKANVSQIPRVLDASFDSSMNKVIFTIEPGLSDYTNLSAKVDYRYTLLPPGVAQVSASSFGGPAGSLSSNNNQQQQLTNNELGSASTNANILERDASAAASSIGQNNLGDMTNNNNNIIQQTSTSGDWAFLTRVPIIKETQEALVDAPPHPVEMRIAICVGQSEPCGPDFLVRMQEPVRGMMWGRDSRVLSMPFLLSIVFVIIILATMATFLHSACTRCVTSKAKQHMMCTSSDKINSNGVGNSSSTDHLSPSNGGIGGAGHHNGLGLHNGAQVVSSQQVNVTDSDNGGGQKSNTTSTTSTNLIGQQTPLELHPGSNTGSEHSSDHSRQVKLDSMSPPNYNNWVTNNNTSGQQQQQQQQQQQHQHADMALMAAHHHHLQQTTGNGNVSEKALIDHLNATANNHYGINQHHHHHQQQQQQQLQDTHQQQQQLLYQQQQQQASHYNLQQQQTSAYNLTNMLDPMSDMPSSPLSAHHSDMWLLQQQQQQQKDDVHNYQTSGGVVTSSAYGYTAGIVPDPMLSPSGHQLPDPLIQTSQSSQYQPFYYPVAHQDPLMSRQQYQHELAIQQQALYGTLPRAGPSIYSQYASDAQANYMSPGGAQQHQDNQDMMQQSVYNDYNSLAASQVPQTTTSASTTGSAVASGAAALQQVDNNNISDYGTTTTGAPSRGGARLIREIIV